MASILDRMGTRPDNQTAAPGPLISLVMPAHNERDGIRSAVESAATTLDLIAPGDWELIVVDDASTDGTGEALDRLAERLTALRVLHLGVNVGHGPALRHGWERATGAWVAQLDSDEEVPADQLCLLWDRSGDADAVLGARSDRSSTTARRVVTGVLKFTARLIGGRPLADANCPCKLVRAEVLRSALALIPAGAFAPSALLAVAAARRRDRIVQVDVTSRPRQFGRSWLVPTRLAKGAARSMVEMFGLGWRMRRCP